MHPALDLSEGRLWLRWMGRRLLPFFYCTPDPDPVRCRRFRDAGVAGVSFSATADFHPYRLAAPVWREDGRRDWSELDRRARAAIEGFPDAMLLLRVHTCSPPWWDQANPGELVVWDEDRTEYEFLHGYSKKTCASWSSRPWRRASAANLERLVAHARASDWGGNVGGILVAAGNTEEWFQIGTMEGLLPDYSEPARDAFRRWLADRGLDGLALASRWGIDAPSEPAGPPPPARRRPRRGPFRDPRADAWAMDFEDFLAAEAASFLGELCGVVHEASDGAWFAGAFFGYLSEMVFHGDGMLHGGHLGLNAVLADDRVDFLASPGSYARRDLVRGATQSMLPIRSALEAGKACFHENDLRTHLLFDDAGYGWTESAARTASAQMREAAFALSHGAGLWWFDMTGAFYDDPTTIEAIRDVCRLAAMPRPPRARAEIACVIDEASFPVTDFPADRHADVVPRQLLELARVGAPHDVRLLSELRPDHGYKFLVFLNLFRVEPEMVDRLARIVQGSRSSLFIGPVGLAPVSNGAPPGPAPVTVLPVVLRREKSLVEIAVDPDAFACEPGMPDGFGRRFRHEARVAGVPSRVRVLGRHQDDGSPAFFDAVVGCARVAYAADPVVPAAALRFLAREALVDVRIDSDDVFASDGAFFSVTARTPGCKRISVPPGSSVVWDPDLPANPAPHGCIIIPMAAGQTVIGVVRTPG